MDSYDDLLNMTEYEYAAKIEHLEESKHIIKRFEMLESALKNNGFNIETDIDFQRGPLEFIVIDHSEDIAEASKLILKIMEILDVTPDTMPVNEDPYEEKFCINDGRGLIVTLDHQNERSDVFDLQIWSVLRGTTYEDEVDRKLEHLRLSYGVCRILLQGKILKN